MESIVTSLRDNQDYGLARYAVHIELPQGVGVIGVGPITGRIIKAVVEYAGEEVTEVPEGENFKVAITYSASNPGFVQSPFDPGWLITMTAMSLDREIKGYEHAIITRATVASALDRIEPLGPMPSHDITLRIKLWGNQDITIIPPCPPEADW